MPPKKAPKKKPLYTRNGDVDKRCEASIPNANKARARLLEFVAAGKKQLTESKDSESDSDSDISSGDDEEEDKKQDELVAKKQAEIKEGVESHIKNLSSEAPEASATVKEPKVKKEKIPKVKKYKQIEDSIVDLKTNIMNISNFIMKPKEPEPVKQPVKEPEPIKLPSMILSYTPAMKRQSIGQEVAERQKNAMASLFGKR